MPTAVLIAQLLVQYGPTVAETIQGWISSGKEPTADDWAKVFAEARKSPDQFRAEAEARFAARSQS
jgi:hypothetical protein